MRGLEGGTGAQRGKDQGGAIFSVDGTLTVLNSTISGNETTGEGGGIVMYKSTRGLTAQLTLRNSIVANNGTRECFVINSVSTAGSGNLIVNHSVAGSGFASVAECPAVVSSDDPQLGALQLNAPGITPTMTIGAGSPAVDSGDLATCLATDQTGTARPIGPGCDIGAYEYGNRPPVAKCRNVTVSAGPSCTASASIDDGSYDPEGGAVTLSQSPAGPYGLGTTQVTLTVTDPDGAASTCAGAVTVTDATPPVITATVSKPILAPMRRHDLVNVGLGATATDACSAPSSFGVQVFGDEDDQAPTDGGGTVFSPDAANIAVGTLRLRAERMDSGNGRVYLIVVTGSDGSGNTGYGCATVVVPHSLSEASVASVNSQAAAALAYCQANNGAAPPGYFTIGDGPVVGRKQ